MSLFVCDRADLSSRVVLFEVVKDGWQIVKVGGM